MVKNPPAHAGNAEDMASILGSERSPGEEDGNPLQYAFLPGKPLSEELGRLRSTASQKSWA